MYIVASQISCCPVTWIIYTERRGWLIIVVWCNGEKDIERIPKLS